MKAEEEEDEDPTGWTLAFDHKGRQYFWHRRTRPYGLGDSRNCHTEDDGDEEEEKEEEEETSSRWPRSSSALAVAYSCFSRCVPFLRWQASAARHHCWYGPVLQSSSRSSSTLAVAFPRLVWLVPSRAVFFPVVVRPRMLCIMAGMDPKNTFRRAFWYFYVGLLGSCDRFSSCSPCCWFYRWRYISRCAPLGCLRPKMSVIMAGMDHRTVWRFTGAVLGEGLLHARWCAMSGVMVQTVQKIVWRFHRCSPSSRSSSSPSWRRGFPYGSDCSAHHRDTTVQFLDKEMTCPLVCHTSAQVQTSWARRLTCPLLCQAGALVQTCRIRLTCPLLCHTGALVQHRRKQWRFRCCSSSTRIRTCPSWCNDRRWSRRADNCGVAAVAVVGPSVATAVC